MSRERASTMQSSGGATNCRLMAPAVRRRLAGHGLVRRRGLTCRQDARGQDAPRQHASGRRVQPATQRGEPLPAHLGPGRWVAESLAEHEAMDPDGTPHQPQPGANTVGVAPSRRPLPQVLVLVLV